jgi:UDP-N-acetylglucosamine:LPS N-acetylglucosamine transferase
MNRRK